MSFGGFFCKQISRDFHATLQGYSVRKIVGGKDGGNNTTMYMTLSFAGVALMVAMVAGMVIVRKRNGRHPHHQVISHC